VGFPELLTLAVIAVALLGASSRRASRCRAGAAAATLPRPVFVVAHRAFLATLSLFAAIVFMPLSSSSSPARRRPRPDC